MFPADAGMNREDRKKVVAENDVPRGRGDEPQKERHKQHHR